MIRIGLNTTEQNTLEEVPRNIEIGDFIVEQFRGKRPIEINAANVNINDVKVFDAFDPQGRDSQAICILNSPGNITIERCHLQAASENIMVGGDTMKIPNCRPTNIIIRDCTLDKPIQWKQLGVPKVKNLLELKDGHNITIERVVAFNCWQSAQTGYGFVFTPRNGGSLRNVIVTDCNIQNVGGIFQIMGRDVANYPTEPRSQITISGGTYRTNKTEMGGTGWFALLIDGPEFVDILGVDAQVDGNAFICVGDSDPIDRLRIENSKFNCSKYGINIGGRMHGDNSLGIIKSLIVKGNTISQASSTFKRNFPENTYI